LKSAQPEQPQNNLNNNHNVSLDLYTIATPPVSLRKTLEPDDDNISFSYHYYLTTFTTAFTTSENIYLLVTFAILLALINLLYAVFHYLLFCSYLSLCIIFLLNEPLKSYDTLIRPPIFSELSYTTFMHSENEASGNWD